MENRIYQSVGFKWSVYILGSLLFLLIPVFTSPDFNGSFSFVRVAPFRREWLNYFLLLAFFYANRFWFLPRYYISKQYFLYTICIVFSFVICTFLPSWLVSMPRVDVLGDTPRPWGMPPEPHGRIGFPVQNLFRFVLVFLTAFIMELSRHLKRVEKARADAEMSLLKAQINPHFLFNTLNSIYALALTKSSKTPDAVAQLSQLMRYAIHDAQFEWITLFKELAYVKGYVSLQSMRMVPSNKLTLDIDNVSDVNKQIGSMLLIPFIENAFKYGTNPNKESMIQIRISADDDHLVLVCENTKVPTVIHEPVSHRQGLANVEQRLKSLYKGAYTLQITDTDMHFVVRLNIPLK